MIELEMLISVLGFLLTIAAFVWKVSRDRQTDLENIDKKVNRVYERLDIVKKYLEDKMELCKGDAEDRFVATKICKILHEANDQNFERLDKKVDVLGEKVDKILSLLPHPHQKHG